MANQEANAKLSALSDLRLHCQAAVMIIALTIDARG